MSQNQRKYYFVQWSSHISPSTIDWIRSLYFSLCGSSMLTLSLKWAVLPILMQLTFGIGVAFFLLGLLLSVIIANRFKRYEKNYDNLPEDTKLSKTPSMYYYEQELEAKSHVKIRFEHFLFYFIWLPAIFCIGYAGASIEGAASQKGVETKDILYKLEKEIQVTRKALGDSIKLMKKEALLQCANADSLESVIKRMENEKDNRQPKAKEKK